MSDFDVNIAKAKKELQEAAREKQLEEELSLQDVIDGIREGVVQVEHTSFEFEEKELYQDTVFLKVPKDLDLMSGEAAELKYPSSRRPQLVLTDDDGRFNVSFSKTENHASEEQMEELVDVIMDTLKKARPDTKFLAKGVKEIGGKQVGILEFNSNHIDGQGYMLMFFVILGDNIGQGGFTAPIEEMPLWQKFARGMLETLRVEG